MLSYHDIIGVDDPVMPPSGVEDLALYRTSKLEYILRNGDFQDEELSVDTDTAVQVAASADPVAAKSHQGTRLQYKMLRVIAGAHQGWVRALAVDSVTNNWFVTGATDATIKVWDLASLDCKAIITGHVMAIRLLAISKRFPYLFSGSEDKEVKCFDLERSNSPLGCEIRNYHGHQGGIYSMALHPELDILFTGGRDTTVRAWDIRSRLEIMTLTGHRNDVTSIIANESDPQVISSSMDGTIRVWDIRNQKTELSLTHHLKSIRLMIDHPGESTFCSGDSLGNIKQWLYPQGDLLNAFNTSERNIINTMSINSTTNQLFAGYDNGKFEVFDYVTGDVIQSSKTIPSPGSSESSIFCSAFDMLGLRLLTGESDHSIKIWGE